MRTAALSTLFISLMFLVLMFSVQETGAASDDPVYIELKISFNDQSSGHIHFFMGSGVEREMNGTDFIPSSTDPYVNDNMDRLLRALQMGGSGSPQITRSILDSSGTLNISKTRISSMAERNYFGLSLDTDFRYPANGISGEFEYLDFIYEVDKMFRKPSGGLDEITSQRLLTFPQRNDSRMYVRVLSHETFLIGAGTAIRADKIIDCLIRGAVCKYLVPLLGRRERLQELYHGFSIPYLFSQFLDLLGARHNRVHIHLSGST